MMFNREPLRIGASRLLRSPRFFQLFLDAVQAAGLVGERTNALGVYGGSFTAAHATSESVYQGRQQFREEFPR
jgi:hypothetical protein